MDKKYQNDSLQYLANHVLNQYSPAISQIKTVGNKQSNEELQKEKKLQELIKNSSAKNMGW